MNGQGKKIKLSDKMNPKEKLQFCKTENNDLKVVTEKKIIKAVIESQELLTLLATQGAECENE